MSSFINAVSARLFRYWSGTEAANATKSGWSPVWIIPREMYSEKKTHYALNDRKELRKILKLAMKNNVQHLIRKDEDRGFWVNSFEYDDVDALPKGLFYVPESVLLGRMVERKQARQFQTDSGPLFVFNNDDYIVSAKPAGLIRDITTFGASVGAIATDAEQQQLDQTTLQSAMLSVLPDLSSFVLTKQVDVDWMALLKGYGIPLAAIGAIYLGASSAYLSVMQSIYDGRFEDQRETLSEALAIQDTVQGNYQVLASIQSSMNEFDEAFPLWRVLEPLYRMKDVKFRRISYQEGSFTLFGEAKRATDVMRILSEQPNVEASWDRPVAKRRTFELFSIKLEVVKGNG